MPDPKHPFSRSDLDPETEEIKQEFQAHLEISIEERRREGMSTGDATAAAKKDFGDFARWGKKCSPRPNFARRLIDRTGNLLEIFRGDLVLAARSFARTPGFAFVVLLTLALSIGANTAIFSVIDGVLLKPLPYSNPHELVRVWGHHPEIGHVQRQ